MSVFKESLSYRPFQYPWAVEMAQAHSIDLFWDTHQLELQDDLRQINAKDGLATKNVPHDVNKAIVLSILSLFTEMDRAVGMGYTSLLQYIKNNEIRNLLLTFAQREVVHQRAYALLAETFGFQNSDWIKFAEYAEMRDKLDLMTADLSKDYYSDKLKACMKIGQILLGEGIGLFGAFASLLNFKRFGFFVGFNSVNEWSLRDETEHVRGNILTLAEMRKELSDSENRVLETYLQRLVAEYVGAEVRFIDLVYKIGNQEDLTKEQLKDFIYYLGELRQFQLGLIPETHVRKNPLPWMDWLLSGAKHSNFFETKVTDYTHSGLTGEIDYSRYAVLR